MLVQTSIPGAGFIISKKAAEQLGDEEVARQGITTGPWEPVDIKQDQFWKLKAVEDHWRKTPEFAELILWVIPEESTQVANFQTGRLDTFVMNIDSKRVIDQVVGTTYMVVDAGSTEHLSVFGNFYVGIGTDKQRKGYDPSLPYISASADINSDEWKKARDVRLAMTIAIDRQTIVDELLEGFGSPLVMWGWELNQHNLDPGKRAWEFNPGKARQLLADAGYGDGFNINIQINARNVAGEIDACEAVGTMWGDIGISTTISKLPFATVRDGIVNRLINEAQCHGTSGRFDPLTLLSVIIPSTAGFTLGADHPILDDLIKKAIGTVDTEERLKIVKEIGHFTYDHVLSMGLYTVNVPWPLSAKIGDWSERLNMGDSRTLSHYEWIPHRK